MVCDPFKQNHKRFINNLLLDSYGNIDNNHFFLSIGKITKWSFPTSEDENVVPPPRNEDTVESDTDFWRSVFAHKRIDREDVSLVVRRYDWNIGEIYTPYSDTQDLFDDINPAKFYVLVDEERVYKCIDNAGGLPSLVAPVHTDAEIRRLSDGYRWKFLYQIPESKRKFLTKTQGNSIGYMPVEYVENLKQNDDRFLQWNVQQSSVNGEISHIRLNPIIKPFVLSDRCLFPNNNNVVTVDVSEGATGVTVASPFMSSIAGYYNNMVFSVDANSGQGQRRRIVSFFSAGSPDQAFIVLDKPISIPLSAGANPSRFSIVPNILVEGDGSSNFTEYNPYAQSAEVSVRFGLTADETENFYDFRRKIDSFELVDSGKNYSFASLKIVAGLTADSSRVSQGFFESFATPVMSPPGGHGSNPVIELGCSSLMIVKSFDGDESGKIATNNEFRQIAIILNPELYYPQVRLKFNQNGSLGAFEVGQTAGVAGPSGAYGEVVSWYIGVTGQVGTSELVLKDIKNGRFENGDVIDGLTVYSVEEKKIAGTDSRRLFKATVVPVPPYEYFDGGANQFRRGMFAQGVGNYNISQKPSRATGEIYAWRPAFGTNTIGDLYLEHVQGEFKVNESLNEFSGYNGTFTYGPSGGALVVETDSVVEEGTKTYDQTTTLILENDGIVSFDENTFEPDDFVTFAYGTTSSSNGYVMNWETTGEGVTGVITLAGTQGRFLPQMTFGYRLNRTEAIGSIDEVIHEGDFVYRSGEVLYIQNMNPISRNPDQKEDIKIVVEF